MGDCRTERGFDDLGSNNDSSAALAAVTAGEAELPAKRI